MVFYQVFLLSPLQSTVEKHKKLLEFEENCKRLREFEENCMRLREFEEIQIPRQSCSGDCE